MQFGCQVTSKYAYILQWKLSCLLLIAIWEALQSEFWICDNGTDNSEYVMAILQKVSAKCANVSATTSSIWYIRTCMCDM